MVVGIVLMQRGEPMDDLISRQAALDTLRTMQTYKLSANDDMLLVNKAEAQTELMLLPSAQPRIIHCRDCKHSSRNRKFGCGLFSRDDDETVPMFADDFCSYAKRREE